MDFAHSLHYLGPLSRGEKLNFFAQTEFLQKLQNKKVGSLSSAGSSDWPYSPCALGVFCHLLLETHGGCAWKALWVKNVSCSPKCLCCTKGLLSSVCPIMPLQGLCSSHCFCRGSSLLTPNLSIISKLCMDTMICLVHSRVLDESPRWIDFSSIWGVGFCFKDYLWIKRKHGKWVTNWMWSGQGNISWRWLTISPCMGRGPLEKLFIFALFSV